MNLKKKIKDDVWKIIDGNKADKPNDKDWVNMTFQLLLESDNFLIENIYDLANDLKEEYESLVDSVEERIINGNGEVLQVLKNINKAYDDKILPLLNRIKKYKNKK
jgi:hypothetical protein